MNIRKFLIAGGNSTMLVWDCPVDQRKEVSLKLLESVEQVGFVETGDLPRLVMMGNELCINATIAFAYTLGNSGELQTSGLDMSVTYENEDNKTTVHLPIRYKKDGNVVLLSGIGFECTNKSEPVEKEYVSTLAKKYNMPAFGVAQFDNNKLTPYVYVKETDSMVKETACGSGSIAISLITGQNEIVQPTGESIFVREEGNKIVVSAKVTELSQ